MHKKPTTTRTYSWRQPNGPKLKAHWMCQVGGMWISLCAEDAEMTAPPALPSSHHCSACRLRRARSDHA